MADITVPSEAAIALALEIRKHCGIMLSPTTVNAACRAMLRNWPNRKDEWRDNITFDGKPIRYSVIMLPLPQESGNG